MKVNYSIGVDPDSSKHGIAVYENGVLIQLDNLTLIGAMALLTILKEKGDVVVHIEDMNSISAVWHNEGGSKRAYGKTSQNVAKCKQAQIEFEKMVDHLEIKLFKHPPSPRWKKGPSKKEFELVTGWKGRSNEDNRSAAYFGFIGVNPNRLIYINGKQK